jgi:hypothetical protein
MTHTLTIEYLLLLIITTGRNGFFVEWVWRLLEISIIRDHTNEGIPRIGMWPTESTSKEEKIWYLFVWNNFDLIWFDLVYPFVEVLFFFIFFELNLFNVHSVVIKSFVSDICNKRFYNVDEFLHRNSLKK